MAERKTLSPWLPTTRALTRCWWESLTPRQGVGTPEQLDRTQGGGKEGREAEARWALLSWGAAGEGEGFTLLERHTYLVWISRDQEGPSGSENWEDVPGVPPTHSDLGNLKMPWAGPPPSKAPSSHGGLRGMRRMVGGGVQPDREGPWGSADWATSLGLPPPTQLWGAGWGPVEPAEVQGLILCTPGPSSNHAEARPSPTPTQDLFQQHGP